MVLNVNSVCFVIPNFVTFATGGAEIQVHYLTQAFLKRGWRVEVVCAGKGHEKEMALSPYLNDDIHYHYYRKRKIRILEFWDVLKVLKKTNSNYYYQRTDFALTAAAYWHSRSIGAKIVYALASDTDVDIHKYTTTQQRFSYSNGLKKWIRYADLFMLDSLIHWAKKRFKYVVCQNQYQIKAYENNFGTRGVIIPNSFVADDGHVVHKENVVLWVGNNHPDKQPEVFVRLAQEFVEFNNWRFIMLGSACDAIDKSALPDNLTVLGAVSYQEANRWFALAKVYVNTSLREGMPNTFIQSWYFSTLVMSLRVDPNGVFSTYKAGINCNDDVVVLNEMLKRVMEGNQAKEQLKMGADYFRAHFDINKNVDMLIAYIES